MAGRDGEVLACVDVAYGEAEAVAAAVLFVEWSAAAPREEVIRRCRGAAPYRRGRLFERELPPLLAVLRAAPLVPSLVVVDGYVWLDAATTPGLGGHLFRAFGGATPVIGVAKRPLAGAPAIPVVRGRSGRPLFVSAAGVGVAWAAERIAAMHGPFRIPTLLRRVDSLARAGLATCRRAVEGPVWEPG